MPVKVSEMVYRDCEEVTSAGAISSLEDLHGEVLLVTGGTGFMGTWIAHVIAHLNDKYQFNTRLILLGPRVSDWIKRVPELAIRRDIELIEMDVRSIVELPQSISMVIHAAGTPDNRVHTSNPIYTAHTIVNGTDAVLKAATRLPDLKKILHVSSGLVYGNIRSAASSENGIQAGVYTDPHAIASLYAESKRMAETLCTAYRSQHRLSIVNVRPFSFIGPYQLLDRPWAINNFIRDAILGGPIRILGNGNTIRSYMYPSDMAWWLLNILVHGISGRSYDLGSSEEITLLQLAEKISKLFPSSKRDIAPLASGNSASSVSYFVPSIEPVQKELSLSLCVDLDTAIQRTIFWNQQFFGG